MHADSIFLLNVDKNLVRRHNLTGRNVNPYCRTNFKSHTGISVHFRQSRLSVAWSLFAESSSILTHFGSVRVWSVLLARRGRGRLWLSCRDLVFNVRTRGQLPHLFGTLLLCQHKVRERHAIRNNGSPHSSLASAILRIPHRIIWDTTAS